MTYHTAGELLQGGAAALLSVCWLLFWEGGKQGECSGQVWVLEVMSFGEGVGRKKKRGGGGAKHCKYEGRGQCRGGFFFVFFLREWRGVSDRPAEGAVSKWEKGRKASVNRGSRDLLKSSILHSYTAK